MTDKPRRAWFQLHLSTAIVLMFVAGGLLWANIRVQEVSSIYPFPFLIEYARGWPMLYLNYSRVGAPPNDQYWTWLNLLINLLCSIGLLTVVAAISERVLRRREARAP